ncbi:MAG: hypothetical protein IT379_07365 [Deltaproteobacteria bacterium]|nr:hypothetical protein [Deltaproteobacteria bacterium]
MNPDYLDLLRALLAADARFLVVGAYAVGIHGRPRATKDLDVWVEASVENAPRVLSALREFGAPLMGLTLEDLQTPGVGLQIGLEPLRIDVLTKISGIEFAEAWPSRIEASFGEGARCPVIGLEALLANKRASGRLQDLADVEALERLRDARTPKS